MRSKHNQNVQVTMTQQTLVITKDVYGLSNLAIPILTTWKSSATIVSEPDENWIWTGLFLLTMCNMAATVRSEKAEKETSGQRGMGMLTVRMRRRGIGLSKQILVSVPSYDAVGAIALQPASPIHGNT